MLDSKSKQILSFLKSQTSERDLLSIDDSEIKDNIPNLTINEIRTALKYLKDNDYLKLSVSVNGSCDVDKLTHKGLNFEELEQQQVPSQVFHIHSATNSAIGNNGTTTINNGYSFDDIRSIISSKPAEDQKELNKLVDTVEILTENGSTISKGFLSKFSDLLVKHSDLISPLGQLMIKWMTNQ